MRVVMFYGVEPQYLLSGIVRDDDGAIKQAYVENGHWDLRVTDTEHLALNGNTVVNRWPKPTDVREVQVSSGGDHNAIMARAAKQFGVKSA